MKRFRFRLERVLKLREQIRDEARQELVRRNSERDHELSVLAYLEGEYRRSRITEGGTYSASELLLVGSYAESLKTRIDHQKEVVANAVRAADEAKDRYVEASRRARALEMLKERKEREHAEASLKEEGEQLDELAIQRFGRLG